MVRGQLARGLPGASHWRGVCLTVVSHRSCRPGKRSWSWTPVALPHRAPRSLLATSGTIAILSKCHHWASACWKEVGKAGG